MARRVYSSAPPPMRTLRALAAYAVLVAALACAVVLAWVHVLTQDNATRIVTGCVAAALYLARPDLHGPSGPTTGGAAAAAVVGLIAGELGAQFFAHGGAP